MRVTRQVGGVKCRCFVHTFLHCHQIWQSTGFSGHRSDKRNYGVFWCSCWTLLQV